MPETTSLWASWSTSTLRLWPALTRSVFIFPQNAVPADFKTHDMANARSFHLETFEKNGLHYFVIGDVALEDIHELSERLKG